MLAKKHFFVLFAFIIIGLSKLPTGDSLRWLEEIGLLGLLEETGLLELLRLLGFLGF